jgi:hypothetical protein
VLFASRDNLTIIALINLMMMFVKLGSHVYADKAVTVDQNFLSFSLLVTIYIYIYMMALAQEGLCASTAIRSLRKISYA